MCYFLSFPLFDLKQFFSSLAMYTTHSHLQNYWNSQATSFCCSTTLKTLRKVLESWNSDLSSQPYEYRSKFQLSYDQTRLILRKAVDDTCTTLIPVAAASVWIFKSLHLISLLNANIIWFLCNYLLPSRTKCQVTCGAIPVCDLPNRLHSLSEPCAFHIAHWYTVSLLR